MMENLKVAAAQFEHRSGDKHYNLGVIDRLSKKAAEDGAGMIAFHECSITGYSFAGKLSRDEMSAIAERIPDGESTQRLIRVAEKNNIAILAGLFEKDQNGDIYNTYICVDGQGLRAAFRKIHPFINKHLSPGKEYVVFEYKGWKCGILICYDNNIIENVRATALLGAEILFAPHVTMCTPSTRPGAGFVDLKLWENRLNDPTSLRAEFDGLKGRAWLMKWLPARAYDNGVYVVFANPIGIDDDQLKNGCSMVIDPFGDILAECRSFDDGYVIANLTYDKLSSSGGSRYRAARKPDMYREVLGRDHESKQRVIWLEKK